MHIKIIYILHVLGLLRLSHTKGGDMREGIGLIDWPLELDMIGFSMYRFVEMFRSELTEEDLEEELGPPGTMWDVFIIVCTFH